MAAKGSACTIPAAMPSEYSKPRIRVQTLGGFSAYSADAAADDGWRDLRLGEKPVALLAFLAWSEGEVARDALAELLWEGASAQRARNSLRQALFRLRRHLGADAIVERDDGLALNLRVMLDIRSGAEPSQRERFARPSVIRGRRFAAWCAEVRGEPLPGSSGPHALADLAPRRDDPCVTARTDATFMEWLTQVCGLVFTGVPVTAWIERTPGHDVEHTLGHLCCHCERHGARIARVRQAGDAPYAPFALERDIAAALGELSGAAGVEPAHRQALTRLATGEPMAMSLLQAALLDLVVAVSEDGPVLLLIEEANRYSVRALRELVNRIIGADGSPVFLGIVGEQGTAPISPLCLRMPAA